MFRLHRREQGFDSLIAHIDVGGFNEAGNKIQVNGWILYKMSLFVVIMIKIKKNNKLSRLFYDKINSKIGIYSAV